MPKWKETNLAPLAQTIEPVPTPVAESKTKPAMKGGGKKKGKKPVVVAETPLKKPARKTANAQVKEPEAQVKKKAATPKPAKQTGKGGTTPGPKKAVTVKAEKPAGRKPGPKKKVVEKPKKSMAAKTKKAPGKKPGRKPGEKATALVPAVSRKKPVPKGKGMVGRKSDLLKMGEGAFLYSLDLQRQIEEMEQVIANYERVFEAVRGLFSREMEEIEELVVGLLE